MLFQTRQRRSWPRLVSLVALFAAAATVTAEAFSPDYIQQGLEECSFVQHVNKIQSGESGSGSGSGSSSLLSQIFAILFPSSSPAINALLATAYISGPPNFLLALCPPNIDPSSLTIMVAFAVGGLLGDTLFHLLPEIFLGEQEGAGGARFVLVEPNRNLLLGVGILSGIVTFMAMDKILRIATGGAGHDHGHAHVHEQEQEQEQAHDQANGAAAAAASSSQTENDTSTVRKRKSNKDDASTGKTGNTGTATATSNPTNPSVKLAGLLNLIADFTHNITDGLALSSSFYASPALGATTTMAVFFHEIPHEVGDFALLIQSGFSKRKAMAAQFVTAIGAFLGTLIGIFVQELAGHSNSTSHPSSPSSPGGSEGAVGHGHGLGRVSGIWGTSLQWSDMLLPFTAGTFLYVGTVAVIPELLETDTSAAAAVAGKKAEIKKTLLQFGAMFVGAAIMLGISWS